MYKTVLFDFDGTIADSGDMVDRIFNELADRWKIRSLSAKDFKHRKGLGLFKKMQMLFFIYRIGGEFKKRYRAHIPSILPFAGMPELLSAVRQAGYNVAILSSNIESNIGEFFRVHHMETDIPVFSSRGIFGKHKAINRFVQRCGCRRDEILYVGDEIRDIKACEASGVDIAFVTWGLDGNEELGALSPRYRIESPAQLKALLLNQNQPITNGSNSSM